MGAVQTWGEEGGLRNDNEKLAAARISEIFDKSQGSTESKLRHFAKFVRRQDMTKWLTRHELFKLQLNVKGSIVECGVFQGGGVMTWGNLSAILEPNNIMRKVYGFDSFEGFPSVSAMDVSKERSSQAGDLSAPTFSELKSLIGAFDQNRFLGHVPKIELVCGDATKTIPKFINQNKHLIVSLLYLDFDLYEPTKLALEHFWPRMPKGSILAFDELDHPAWPGETMALLETLGIKDLELRRFDFDPYVSFAIL
ncbi:MAG: dTDP-6-deoxy-L-hexose 3-O-methyltransferase [Deltaproteobacteria bacterium CG11_big_fil_rev_8_21_14_0_20_45_16]|nr:MAG: dTDP-6-deoxy-L-hexose 3-O-methyltransferase [Deltaproteobacteria bacterium CG11_big_fil_rev_8_21_14_0_20_45_16]